MTKPLKKSPKSSTQTKLQPPCSQWGLWVGPEIEGTVSIGARTIFIRRLPAGVTAQTNFEFLKKSGATRVWFCKEFTDWRIMKVIMKLFKDVAIEAEPKTLEAIPEKIRNKARIYLKVIPKVPLKPGDFVCVGQPFEDESFELGKGARVNPDQYLGDIRMF